MNRTRQSALVFLAGLALAATSLPALGQSSKSKGSQPAASSPATPAPAANPAGRKEPETGPFLTRDGLKEWNMVYTVTIHSDRVDQTKPVREGPTSKSGKAPKITPFEFETAGIIFPQIPETASSESEEFLAGSTGPQAQGYRGVLRVDDAVVDSEPAMLKGYPGNSLLGRWDAGERGKTLKAREIQLEVTIPMRAWKVTYDEAGAMKLPWPGSWPKVAQSMMAPQLFIENGLDASGQVAKYDDAAIQRALDLWKAEWKLSDFKSVSPAALAKMITAKVWQTVQPNGDGLTFRPRTGELAGIALKDPSMTLIDGKGSEHDMTVLLAALMRKAGLPTRLVIGYEAGDKSDRWLDKGGKSSKLRTWVEFCLYDEQNNTINWIPVDVVKLRKSSNRPAALDRPWKYFGTNDQLDHILPFAFHFHPPTDVVSYGSPGFWGWFVSPKAPEQAEQAIRISASSQSKRANEPDNAKKPKRN